MSHVPRKLYGIYGTFGLFLPFQQLVAVHNRRGEEVAYGVAGTPLARPSVHHDK